MHHSCMKKVEETSMLSCQYQRRKFWGPVALHLPMEDPTSWPDDETSDYALRKALSQGAAPARGLPGNQGRERRTKCSLSKDKEHLFACLLINTPVCLRSFTWPSRNKIARKGLYHFFLPLTTKGYTKKTLICAKQPNCPRSVHSSEPRRKGWRLLERSPDQWSHIARCYIKISSAEAPPYNRYEIPERGN